MFTKTITLFQALIGCIVIGLIIAFIVQFHGENKADSDQENKDENPKLKIVRDHSYRFTRPLRYFDLNTPSSDLIPIKNEIKKIISEGNSEGKLTCASIYLRNLETGEWTSINDQQAYHPGSLFKVPMLIYYLKQSEKDPSILEKKLRLPNDFQAVPSQTFNSQAIQKNQSYTVRELLKYMVSYSDNNATRLLNEFCNQDELKKMFKDLSLAEPNMRDKTYTISIQDYSIFLRTLYNATYLNPTNSDFALNLLTQSSFNKGLAEKLPDDVPIARKFGEMYDGTYRELHECGIIYCNSKPYMLTIMTKGYNATSLASVISSISDTVFKFFCV